MHGSLVSGDEGMMFLHDKNIGKKRTAPIFDQGRQNRPPFERYLRIFNGRSKPLPYGVWCGRCDSAVFSRKSVRAFIECPFERHPRIFGGKFPDLARTRLTQKSLERTLKVV